PRCSACPRASPRASRRTERESNLSRSRRCEWRRARQPSRSRARGQPLRKWAGCYVATVLEGSVRKAGNWLRISVQLVKVADGYHLWSERYDRTLEDIFAVQDDIAQSVVKELRSTLLAPPSALSP